MILLPRRPLWFPHLRRPRFRKLWTPRSEAAVKEIDVSCAPCCEGEPSSSSSVSTSSLCPEFCALFCDDGDRVCQAWLDFSNVTVDDIECDSCGSINNVLALVTHHTCPGSAEESRVCDAVSPFSSCFWSGDIDPFCGLDPTTNCPNCPGYSVATLSVSQHDGTPFPFNPYKFTFRATISTVQDAVNIGTCAEWSMSWSKTIDLTAENRTCLIPTDFNIDLDEPADCTIAATDPCDQPCSASGGFVTVSVAEIQTAGQETDCCCPEGGPF